MKEDKGRWNLSRWPSLAVIVPACNEERYLEKALRSLCDQDYPNFRVIVVNDRSTDETPIILERLQREYRRLSVETITALPRGWLGKPHALWKGANLAGDAEWLLFTDADVIYAPETLRRAVGYAETQRLDLLTMYPGLIMRGFWERAVIGYFALASFFAYPPWRVNNSKSGAYFAIGAFNLVRRAAYDRVGTYRRLAMEVVDDARLGWLMKRSGARMRIIIGLGAIQIRWQEGLRGVIDGLTKNCFAGFNFSLVRTIVGSFALLLVSMFPFLGLFFASGLAFWLLAATIVAIFGSFAMASRGTGMNLLYALAHPAAAVIMIYIMLRSAFTTIRNGGVSWRGTYYDLNSLRAERSKVNPLNRK